MTVREASALLIINMVWGDAANEAPGIIATHPDLAELDALLDRWYA